MDTSERIVPTELVTGTALTQCVFTHIFNRGESLINLSGTVLAEKIIKDEETMHFEIKADFDDSSASIYWRNVGQQDWQSTPFKVEEANQDEVTAVALVHKWLY